MKKCSECNGNMKEMKGKTPEGVGYTYYKCAKCGEEIVEMKQLHAVADKYREMKKYHAKLTPWGKSLGLRIPNELVKKYNFKEEVVLIPEKKGIRIVA
ncbi:MAG: AbrB/MazE/SpoVT family DNA-binding domain-containing protein [Nanoarchaeota archaeon]|nr:AbrB/MazE/SpoVT family DNA-binding domain-containing protein [Nanoarchaeota archaeon]MBU1321284.1 AbrB/MazE/SpoVT family DNA-binding domain-containing protein [Nanoarchaeota archaeon]MBU1597114.1 AbrB/MazE/SpoVT family DNA-binding domain-containing protein [Nanoarchaeota archaeon]MBU2442143.1 AbrB/MazE/SpoVT family DNA-binding domain-containing protein [Nanoarchaeota archaeon]